MALQTYAGSFATRSGTGTQNVTGLPFQPTTILFYVGGSLQPNANWIANIYERQSFGVCASNLSQWYVTSFSTTLAGNWNVGRATATGSCVRLLDLAGGLTIAVTSLNANGFSLNYSQNTYGSGQLISYLALGGDVTQSASGVATNSTSINCGFSPNLIITGIARGTQAISSAGDVYNHMGIGFGDPASLRQGCVARQLQTFVSGSESFSLHTVTLRDNRIVANGRDVASAITLTGATSNSFTLSYSSWDSSQFGWLALRGGSWYVSTGKSRSGSIGTRNYTGATFTPSLYLATSGGLGEQSNNVNNANAGVFLGGHSGGSGSGWSEGYYNVHGWDADTSTPGEHIKSTLAHHFRLAIGQHSAFISGGYQINWTTVDATEREFVYVVGGNSPIATPSGIAVPRSLGSPLLSQGVLPAGISVPVATGDGLQATTVQHEGVLAPVTAGEPWLHGTGSSKPRTEYVDFDSFAYSADFENPTFYVDFGMK